MVVVGIVLVVRVRGVTIVEVRFPRDGGRLPKRHNKQPCPTFDTTVSGGTPLLRVNTRCQQVLGFSLTLPVLS